MDNLIIQIKNTKDFIMSKEVFNQSLVNQREIEEATKKETIEALVNAVTVVGYYDEFESKALDISKHFNSKTDTTISDKALDLWKALVAERREIEDRIKKYIPILE